MDAIRQQFPTYRDLLKETIGMIARRVSKKYMARNFKRRAAARPVPHKVFHKMPRRGVRPWGIRVGARRGSVARALWTAQKKRRTQQTFIQRGAIPMPLRQILTMPYSQELTLSIVGSTNTMTKNTFRLNSMYDPDQTGTGHQPYFWDQYTEIYNNYQVIAARWKVTFINESSDSDVTLMAAVNTTTDTDMAGMGTISGIVWSIAQERPDVRTKILPPLSSGGGKCTISGANYMAKSFGLTQKQYQGDAAFHATVSGNPTRTYWLEAGVCALGTGPAQGQTIRVIFNCVYHFRFWGWKTPGQS